MLQNELQREGERLREKIVKLRAELQPKQAELQTAQERLTHIEALLAIKIEGAEASRIKAPRGTWAEICREHGWQIKRDSPHRVVIRQNPILHQSIPHWCTYDNRQYP